MATADDELTTDISIEGDPEEIDRFRKVCPEIWQYKIEASYPAFALHFDLPLFDCLSTFTQY